MATPKPPCSCSSNSPTKPSPPASSNPTPPCSMSPAAPAHWRCRLAQHAGQVHGIDFSEAMLAIFRNKIEQAGHRNIALHCGDAQTLPYADATFDAAFSLFGLMFFPDRQQRLRRNLPHPQTGRQHRHHQLGARGPIARHANHVRRTARHQARPAATATLRHHTGKPRTLQTRDGRSRIPQRRDTQRHQSLPRRQHRANSGTTWSRAARRFR